MIKHIVLPGGGPNFAILYGAIKQLNMSNFWKIDDIESIHGVSCGSLVALLVLLTKIGLDWDDIDKYIINRPWEKVYTLNPEMFLMAYKKKGIIDLNHFCTGVEPFFRAVDISIDITLLEFYNKTKIFFHIIATNFTDMIICDLNHISFPDLKLITAIQMSSAIPPLIQPVFYNNKYYADGGMLANNPIKQCLEIAKNETDILGFKVEYLDPIYGSLNEESTIIEYLSQVLIKLAGRSDQDFINGVPKISNIIHVQFKTVINGEFWTDFLNKPDFRKQLISTGEEYAELFLKYKS